MCILVMLVCVYLSACWKCWLGLGWDWRWRCTRTPHLHDDFLSGVYARLYFMHEKNRKRKRLQADVGKKVCKRKELSVETWQKFPTNRWVVPGIGNSRPGTGSERVFWRLKAYVVLNTFCVIFCKTNASRRHWPLTLKLPSYYDKLCCGCVCVSVWLLVSVSVSVYVSVSVSMSVSVCVSMDECAAV